MNRLFLNSDQMLELKFGVIRGIAAISIALLMAAILIFIMSDMPLEALRQLLFSPLRNERQIVAIFERMIPLLFTGLAVCVMFSAKQFNLAAEGSVLLGAFVGGMCAIYLTLPGGVHMAVSVLAGAVVCGLVMLIPSLLQTKLGANVLVSTLMLNYIIMFVVQYLMVHIFADKTQGALMSERFRPEALIPKLSHETSWGIILGLVMAVAVSLFMYRTKWGYAIRMVGINEKFAGYSGMKVAAVLILCQVLGGMLAGMGGAVEMLGYYERFRWRLLPGYGWSGITIAILAKNNPMFVPLAAFFLAYLSRGCLNMAIHTDVPSEMLDVIQAVIFLFFAADKFLARYRQRMVAKKAKRELEISAKEAGANA
ncbi:MAG: ABC transporter permease [Defluviitaleaceae bacterium]|nr:ABC transporter permease [Defluviitaleaceae bacterium]